MFHPSSVHLSIYLSVRLSVFVRRLRGWGGWFFFDGGLLFHKINKWYLRSGVESITNGGGRKGNLGRSAQAGDGTEWLLTVKYNQCITKHITRGLLKNPSTPSLPPMKMADIIMADMVWHWKSLSESLGETFFIVVPHRNRRCDVSLQVNGGARGGYFSIHLHAKGADRFHDTCCGESVEWYVVQMFQRRSKKNMIWDAHNCLSGQLWDYEKESVSFGSVRMWISVVTVIPRAGCKERVIVAKPTTKSCSDCVLVYVTPFPCSPAVDGSGRCGWRRRRAAPLSSPRQKKMMNAWRRGLMTLLTLVVLTLSDDLISVRAQINVWWGFDAQI